MSIKWINGQYKEDSRIFDSEFEAEEWVDGLFTDFSIYMNNEVNVGYATLDKKVMEFLSVYLLKWAEWLGVKVNIHTDEEKVDGKVLYKIWTTRTQ